MPRVCDICVEVIEEEEEWRKCTYEQLTGQEMELIFGKNTGWPDDFFACSADMHTACIEKANASRSCCAPSPLRTDRCPYHSGSQGFLCYECNRWHAVDCAAQGILEQYGRAPAGICKTCADAHRADAAVTELRTTPTDLLEALTNLVRGADQSESTRLRELAELVRSFRDVRVPMARKDTLSLELIVEATRRMVSMGSALQSGLEREFLELLNEIGLAHEFHVQRPIPIDVAASDGSGRRPAVTTPDFVHTSLPYVVYLDGRIAHATEDQLTRDSEISAELTRMGFVVRRFRTKQLSDSFRIQTRETIKRDLEKLRSRELRKGVVG